MIAQPMNAFFRRIFFFAAASLLAVSLRAQTPQQPQQNNQQPQQNNRQPQYQQPQQNNRQPQYQQPQQNNRQPQYQQPQQNNRQPQYQQPQQNNRQPQYQQPQQNNQQPKQQQASPQPQQQVSETPVAPRQTPQAFVQAAKVDPVLLANGFVPVYYERQIIGPLTGEAALGITFRDFIFHLLENRDNDDQMEITKTALGFGGRLGLRLYPSSRFGPMEGPYLALYYQFRTYGWDQTYALRNAAGVMIEEASVTRETRQFHDFAVVLGKQAINRDNFLFDLYAGLGMRSRTLLRGDITSIQSGAQVVEEEETQNAVPMLMLGVKMGFAF